MPKIEMSFEESQKFLKGAREGKNVYPPRKEYTFEESQQLLKEANADRGPAKDDSTVTSPVRPTTKTAAGVKIPRDAVGGDIGGPDAKAKNVDNSGLTKEKLP